MASWFQHLSVKSPDVALSHCNWTAKPISILEIECLNYTAARSRVTIPSWTFVSGICELAQCACVCTVRSWAHATIKSLHKEQITFASSCTMSTQAEATPQSNLAPIGWLYFKVLSSGFKPELAITAFSCLENRCHCWQLQTPSEPLERNKNRQGRVS